MSARFAMLKCAVRGLGFRIDGIELQVFCK